MTVRHHQTMVVEAAGIVIEIEIGTEEVIENVNVEETVNAIVNETVIVVVRKTVREVIAIVNIEKLGTEIEIGVIETGREKLVIKKMNVIGTGNEQEVLEVGLLAQQIMWDVMAGEVIVLGREDMAHLVAEGVVSMIKRIGIENGATGVIEIGKEIESIAIETTLVGNGIGNARGTEKGKEIGIEGSGEVTVSGNEVEELTMKGIGKGIGKGNVRESEKGSPGRGKLVIENPGNEQNPESGNPVTGVGSMQEI